MITSFRLAAALLLLCLCLLAPDSAAADASAVKPASTPIQQLRIYEIFENTKDRFHVRFRDHAMRIMRRHDFRIVAMWETQNGDRTEFAYLLEWPDEATMQDRWKRFLADEEWSRIKRESRGPQPMMGRIEDRTLKPVAYSPERSLLD